MTDRSPEASKESTPVTTGRIFADVSSTETANVLTLHWETTGKTAEVYVSQEGRPEKIFSRTAKMLDRADWIRPGVSYVFRLYDVTDSRRLLDEITILQPISGKLSLHKVDHTRPFEGVVDLEWQVTPPGSAQVYLSEGDGPERLVCRGPSGSFAVRGLKAGARFGFRLYGDTASRPLLDEATFFLPVEGRITAHPNPVPLEAGAKTTLSWEISATAIGEVCVNEDDSTEKVVCRGASGSFEVNGLRAGVDYLFRLYGQTESRDLLDEVSVRLSEVPWSQLLDRLKGARNEAADQLAAFIGEVLGPCIHNAKYPKWFRLWEEHGVHVTPVHFYEPIPDSRTLDEDLWNIPLTLPGVDLNDSSQRHLLCDVFPAFQSEYDRIPLESPTEGVSFYLKNGRFEGLDPLLAYCMVRQFHPRQIIEVGSGFSTLILAQAALVNGDTELHSVEPYPAEFLINGVAGLTSLLVKKVEEVELSFFDRLESGDFLFIDTSHVVRIGGDVNHLFLEILPRLKPGVIVHVHDIFLPYEYPKDWVVERRRFWTEQYLLQAFLAHNSEFEVLVSSGYLKATYPEELKTIFPTGEPWQGGSFWMRRKPT